MACRCCNWWKKKSYDDLGTPREGTGSVRQPAPSRSGVAASTIGRVIGGREMEELVGKKVQQSKATGVLALRECALTALPADSMAEASSLRSVDVSVNKIRALPDGIANWDNLQSLTCAQNQLIGLPGAIGRLAGLQKLVVSANSLSSLPPELANLGKLRLLDLGANALGPRLPDVFRGALAGALEELDLSENALTELAPSLGQLAGLKRLVVAKNELRELPGHLNGLGRLGYLDAAENRLTAVPQGLLEGTVLHDLCLKGNAVDRLQLQQTPGFDAFMERRKQRLDSRIDSNVGAGRVDLTVCGLD